MSLSLTRPDSDPASEVSSTAATSMSTSAASDTTSLSSTTPTTSSDAVSTSPLTTPTISATIVSATVTTSSTPSTLMTLTTSSSSSVLSSSPSLDTTATTSIGSTSIEWGPAITASPLPTAQSGGISSHATVQPAKHGFAGLSKRQQHATIATAVIVGVLMTAFALFALYKRRKGATMKDMFHFRRHYPSTIIDSPTPQEERLTALPIYREERYSVRSSMHPSMLGTPRSSSRADHSAPVPPQVANKFHVQNPYVKDVWKTTGSPVEPRTPRTPTRAGRSFLVDASPPPQHLSEPDQARWAMNRHSAPSHVTHQSSGETTKSGLAISVRETPQESAGAVTPPDSPNSQHDLKDRWSWTNSQAPTTPRLYAPSFRSSISSLPRFRSIKSWVRGQSDRIVEEERPITSQATKMAVLRNKATLPTLAPPVTMKLGKSHGKPDRVQRLSSASKQQPKTTATPLSPKLEGDSTSSIEMSERSGRADA